MKRVKLGMALALLLGALVLAGCGGGGSSSSSTSESSTTANSSGSEGSGSEGSGPEGKAGGMFNISEEAKACLKEKGFEMPEFKGGEGGPPGGGERPEGGPPGGGKAFGGEHSEEMKKDFEECGVELGGFKGGPGGEGGKPNMNSAAFKEQIEEYAACVRENGYEIAEPNFSGEGPVFEKSESESAAFKKASASCESLLKGGSGESESG
ncbi:MAG TPA: hypothetical protein VH268_06455 [Solirubrobacterales bacterium]|nr:hypothetical protein [Solirubrobacterales bacterium]